MYFAFLYLTFCFFLSGVGFYFFFNIYVSNASVTQLAQFTAYADFRRDYQGFCGVCYMSGTRNFPMQISKGKNEKTV